MQICDVKTYSLKLVSTFIIADIGRCVMLSPETAGK